ncbi:hypothetical protein SMG44B_20741 [Stenotrophomonas maltophilia]
MVAGDGENVRNPLPCRPFKHS